MKTAHHVFGGDPRERERGSLRLEAACTAAREHAADSASKVTLAVAQMPWRATGIGRRSALRRPRVPAS